jgi:hypothetical protein
VREVTAVAGADLDDAARELLQELPAVPGRAAPVGAFRDARVHAGEAGMLRVRHS